MFIRTSAVDANASDVLLFGSDQDIREAYKTYVASILKAKADKIYEEFPREWLKAYCAAFTPNLDLHIDQLGLVRGHDKKVVEEAQGILSMLKKTKREKLDARYEEVMQAIMEAYDSAHGLT